MNTRIDEIAPDLFRISTYIHKFDLQFNQFLVRDEEPLLFHTGMKGMFSLVQKAVGKVLDPARVRWVGFSHFEADECGSLNEWLALAPAGRAEFPASSEPPSASTTSPTEGPGCWPTARCSPPACYRFRHLDTPQVPHAWDAALLFEETGGALFCSDLCLQNGNREPLTAEDILEPSRQALLAFEAGPLANSYPWTKLTLPTLERLAPLEPWSFSPSCTVPASPATEEQL